jgi:hypothetical protein
VVVVVLSIRLAFLLVVPLLRFCFDLLMVRHFCFAFVMVVVVVVVSDYLVALYLQTAF